ncbi:ATP-grasp domain-containing protein [Tissierella sp. MB52-C2]|uniref:ATP-grasp domain-containing protein n=1 Tax=Tissierella sp. MB52-C2 TaxID=3070999 RepID=UPI00280B03EA|nr:ATP-grasp domain-containing protein [Tissierella sp. MB52-C2]WMM24195.1 ATP-grasp domain-containing protein [Tissierella sp. MB52-C2]
MQKDDRLKAIVLGGTSAHIELIQRLKRRGYYTILIDYYENPIAKKYANEHIQESTLDKERVLQIAKDKKVDLVITTCIDQANITAIYVSEKLGYHVPYSYETSLNVTNKIFMKRIMEQNSIPTSKYINVKEISEYEDNDLKYPLIVKPSDSNGSKGVNKVVDDKELLFYLNNALKISRSNQAIIEEYIEGKEIGIDCFIKNHEAHILTIRERKKINCRSSDLQQITGTVTPPNIDSKKIKEIKEIVEKIALVFQLDNTPLMVQAIISNEEINIIEFAPRIGGGESSRMIELITGFDIINQTINSFMGLPIDIATKKNEQYFSETLLYAKPSIMGFIKGDKELIEKNIIEYIVQYKTKGMTIGDDISSINRVGAFVVKGNNLEELNTKIETAIKKLEIHDIMNSPIMRKDIYL